MVKRTIDNFDIGQICDCGQCFRMMQKNKDKNKNTYSVIASGRYLEVEQKGKEISFSCEEAEFDEFWRDYFDIDRDYAAYMESVNPKDGYLVNAIQFGSGIRILHQDLWEMTVSFLISQQNNIVRIRRCIGNICERYGEVKENFRKERYYAFPRPEILAGLAEDELKECNLGYRSKYVIRTARSVAEGAIDMEAVRDMGYEEAKAELLGLYGVGEKVADCICLFGLHHLEAFPMDTHILQAMEKHYRRGFPRRRYKGFEGVMQQYVFYWELRGEKRQD